MSVAGNVSNTNNREIKSSNSSRNNVKDNRRNNNSININRKGHNVATTIIMLIPMAMKM